MGTPSETVPRPTTLCVGRGTPDEKPGQGAGHFAGRPRTLTLKELAAQVLERVATWDTARDRGWDNAGRGCPTGAVGVGQTEAERWRYCFHERSGIRELDGGMSRSDAEAAALLDCAQQWRCENPLPANEPTDPCVHCGLPMAQDDRFAVLAWGGHAWMHALCWAPMDEQRELQAEAAVRALLGSI